MITTQNPYGILRVFHRGFLLTINNVIDCSTITFLTKNENVAILLMDLRGIIIMLRSKLCTNENQKTGQNIMILFSLISL